MTNSELVLYAKRSDEFVDHMLLHCPTGKQLCDFVLSCLK